MNIIDNCIKFALGITWSLCPASCPRQKFCSNTHYILYYSKFYFLVTATNMKALMCMITSWWIQILSDLTMLQKINGSEAWALMTSGVALLPTNSNLGQIMRIMEMNISLLEPLFILYVQIFNNNILILAMTKTLFGITKMVSKNASTAGRNLLYFTYNQIINRKMK